MAQPGNRRRNQIQNLLILLLSVTAGLLFFQTREVSFQTPFPSFLAVGQQTAITPSNQLTSVTAPVRVAITGAYGRYGTTTVTTSDTFSSLGGLLREALGSAGEMEPCAAADVRAALSVSSVFYDFTASLPLSVLSGLVGGQLTANTPARWLLLAPGEDSVTLYIGNEERLRRCETKVTADILEELISSYQLGNASFAYELEAAETLSPYTLLFTAELPVCPVLSASTPDNNNALLSALAFNPNTNSRYPESDGTEVVVENERTVHIRPDGVLAYDSGGDGGTPTIEAAGETPTAKEAVLGCSQLLAAMLPAGDASLCVQSIQQTGGGWELTFDYAVDGFLIRQSSGVPAATVLLSGNAVQTMSLCVRQYTRTESASTLLPLTQALAIARQRTGAELNLCYLDSGSNSVSAVWLAE